MFRYIKNGKLVIGRMNTEDSQVMVESESDLDALSASGECVPGTIAFTAGYNDMWQLSASGEWVDVYKTED